MSLPGSNGDILSQRSIDTTLRRHGMGPRGEQLADACGVEASLSQTEGGSQARTTRSHDQRIVLVIYDGVVLRGGMGRLLCAEGL